MPGRFEYRGPCCCYSESDSRAQQPCDRTQPLSHGLQQGAEIPVAFQTALWLCAFVAVGKGQAMPSAGMR